MLYAKYLKIEVHYEKSKDSIETRLVTMNKNIAKLYIDEIREVDIFIIPRHSLLKYIDFCWKNLILTYFVSYFVLKP